MSIQRSAPVPPELKGFTYVKLLGRGGYSDVFLFEQQRPRRLVAVKVLLESSLNDGGRKEFSAEADLMARVSTHPYIVTIYDAAVSADGRPFLAMEYYPRDNMALRSRAERMAVADVLRIGVQVASAVETAHRAGILHRDIKPANILTSEYGRPGLTDFGISATRSELSDDEGGMSVPWSPPEMFRAGSSPDERADVYSLAATVWHLLAGRSPFEIPGGDNRHLSMIRRIEGSTVPETGRDDVPESLERALRQSMSKLPDARPGSALEFARALNSIQQELSMGATPIDIPEDAPVAARQSERDDEDHTRLKPRVVEAQRPIGTTATRPVPDGVSAAVVPPRPGGADLISGVPGEAHVGVSNDSPTPRVDYDQVDELDLTRTTRRSFASEAAPQSEREPVPTQRSSLAARVAAAGIVAVLAIGGAWAVVSLRGSSGTTATPSGPSTSLVQVSSVSPAIVTVKRTGPTTATVTLSSDDPAAGGFFEVTRTDAGMGSHEPQRVTGSTLKLTGLTPKPKVCVRVVRFDKSGNPQASPTPACEP